MGFCRKCGKSNVEDARFCEYCGTEFTAKADVLAETVVAYGSMRKEEPAARILESEETKASATEETIPVGSVTETSKPKRDKAFYSAKDLLDDVPRIPASSTVPKTGQPIEHIPMPDEAVSEIEHKTTTKEETNDDMHRNTMGVGLKTEEISREEEPFIPVENPVYPISPAPETKTKDTELYSPANAAETNPPRKVIRSEDERRLSFEEYDKHMITVARVNPPMVSGNLQEVPKSAPHASTPQASMEYRASTYPMHTERNASYESTGAVLSHRVSKATEMAGIAEHPEHKSGEKKRNVKPGRLLIVGIVALLVLTAVGFGIFHLTQIGKKPDADTQDGIITGYRWLKEPYLEADEVDVIPFGRPENAKTEEDNTIRYTNEGKKHLYAGISMVQKQGKWGLLDYEGKEVVPAEYEEIYTGYDKQILLFKNGTCYVYKDGELKQTSEEEAYGTDPDAALIWDKKRDALALIEGDGTGKAPYSHDGLYAVRGATPNGSQDEETGSLTYDNFTMNYAVAFGDKRLSDFIYEITMSENEGLIAVKRNGKWGYVNTEGKEIVPVIYDGVQEERHSVYHNSEFDTQKSEMAYVPTCGVIAVQKDGKWGYIDKEGREITGFIFEEARPLYQNKAWVKEQGKWGVAEFGNYGTPEESQKTTETEKEAPTEELSEKTIKAKFEEADKIYFDWVYYPMHKAEHSSNGRGAVKDKNVKSKADMKNMFLTAFSPALTERFIAKLKPEERGGTLYINVPQGDYNIPFSTRSVKLVEKMSDSEYCVTLFVDEYGTAAEMKLLYAKENGKWGFSDYVENLEEKLSGTWTYKNNTSVEMEFAKNGKVKRTVDGEIKEGTYEKIGGDSVKITVPSEEEEMYALTADHKLVSVENERNFWGKEKANGKEYNCYFSTEV